MDVAVAEAFAVVARLYPHDDAVVYRERRLSWTELSGRAQRVAQVLHLAGLGAHHERSALEDHQSGQRHLAIMLRTCNEYLEAFVGSFIARVGPANVNYRYTAAELRHLLDDARPSAIVVHSEFTPLLTAAGVAGSPALLILQVADDSGLALMPGATWYEDALAAAPLGPPPVQASADDLYLLYTGGTTGLPKGVMWRNADARVACFGGIEVGDGDHPTEAIAAAAVERTRTLVAAPLMHGAGQWMAMRTWWLGGCVFLPWHNDRFDPPSIVRQLAEERIGLLLIVGDAFARPLIDELRRSPATLSDLTVIMSGGAPLSAGVTAELHRLLPGTMVVDGLGSSEAGGQAAAVFAGSTVPAAQFPFGDGGAILSADRTRLLGVDDTEIGWLARTGRLPLGYLGDPDRTAATYVTVDGRRYAVPGDMASHTGTGQFHLHGRDSITINSGGEKIFAEEVEAALGRHPGVYDCVVVGRPSARWGHEVVAIVQWADGYAPDHHLLGETAAAHIARYKLPKLIIDVDRVERSPAGKADYRWARALAESYPATGA